MKIYCLWLPTTNTALPCLAQNRSSAAPALPGSSAVVKSKPCPPTSRTSGLSKSRISSLLRSSTFWGLTVRDNRIRYQYFAIKLDTSSENEQLPINICGYGVLNQEHSSTHHRSLN